MKPAVLFATCYLFYCRSVGPRGRQRAPTQSAFRSWRARSDRKPSAWEQSRGGGGGGGGGIVGWTCRLASPVVRVVVASGGEREPSLVVHDSVT